MAGAYGKNFKVTLGGTSHGPEVNVRIEGVPEGTVIDYKELDYFMERRQAKGLDFATGRHEPDDINWRRGVLNFGGELGIVSDSVIEAYVENKDVRPEDYERFKEVPRPGHADFAAIMKDGEKAEIAGGGRFSGRLTVGLCIAGGIAKQILEKRGITIFTDIAEIGGDDNPIDFEDLLGAAQGQKDSVGGIIECGVMGVKAGSCGDSYWDGLEGRIAQAIFGIPGVKGVEFGSGFEGTRTMGSVNNDPFAFDEEGNVITLTNNHGGILGGIASGMPIVVKAAIKPTPSIGKEQQSVNLKTGKLEKISVTGRHDPCIVPRALPCVEAAVAIALLDALMEEERPESEGDTIEALRSAIDRQDDIILNALTERFKAAERIGAIKAAGGMPVQDETREREVLKRVEEKVPSEYEAHARAVMETLIEESKKKQIKSKAPFGILGRKLGHSYSPEIHRLIGEKTGNPYEFQIFEREPEELEAFIKGDEWEGLTVTIPYKEKVIPLLDSLSPEAALIGAVNVVVRQEGKLVGYNTDYFGFIHSLEMAGVAVKDKSCLILGQGGASKAVLQALKDMGAQKAEAFSARKPDEIPGEDVEIIVNTTPVGMFPKTEGMPADPSAFPKAEWLIDIVYNPLRTHFLCKGKEKGLKTLGGMGMLVAQAIYAAMLFTDRVIENRERLMADILSEIKEDVENIVLIGPAGIGKTTVGKNLEEITGKEFYDTDLLIVQREGKPIEEIFSAMGEEGFRRLETQIIKELAEKRGAIISCGGGAVTGEENYFPLAMNGRIFLIDGENTAEVATEGRPLYKEFTPEELRKQRLGLYNRWADEKVDAAGKEIGEISEYILEKFNFMP